ncbi:MAG: lipase maturation factor family protein [Bryobacteraceae bacterium]
MRADHNEQGRAMQNLVNPKYSEPSISSLGSLKNVLARLSSPSSHSLIENVFLRLLGLTYLAAFGSLLPQVIPLLGSDGIEPAKRFLDSFRPEMAPSLVFSIPTFFWISAADGALRAACIVGCVASVLLVVRWQSRFAAAICWVLYLSLVSVGAPFLNFQWDALLLEAGFLALFSGSPILIWAYRLLLFRLMFESGIVKLTSGDPNWRNLHALRFHFMTQPLPNPLAYYAYRLPASVLDAFTAATFAIELFVPFLLFCPKRVRYAGVSLLMLLQLSIILTGNYAFFNLLTVAICLWGLDDSVFEPVRRSLQAKFPGSETLGFASGRLRLAGSFALLFLISAGVLQVIQSVDRTWVGTLNAHLRWIAPFEMVNSYGLFAVMTTTRPEIILQGSDDQVHWLDYSFPYKPGEPHRGLPWIAPYQPRLDWQMWFAALGDINENTWVGNLMYRIMTGDPAPAKLLEPSPFSRPPHYMRALLYDYRFTTPELRRRTGAVWERTLIRTWFGPVSLTGR